MVYTYALIFRTPYPGFEFNPSNGQILGFFNLQPPENSLQVGDRLIQIGTINFEGAQLHKHQALFDSLAPGDTLHLTIERNGKQLTVPWIMPALSSGEVRNRIINYWLLGYIFWGFGTATLLFLRPKDTRWRLLIAFNYLTAIWLVIGNSSPWGSWNSAILFRMIVWISLPVYLHLHWVFPVPLGRLPTRLTQSGYALGAALAVIQWFEWIPNNLFYMGFAFTAVGLIVLMAAHFIRQPGERRTMALLFAAAVLIMLPLAVLSMSQFWTIPWILGSYAIAAFPALPGIYFYVVYRRQLGGLELRANRVISLYAFLISIATATILLLSYLSIHYNFSRSTFIVGLAFPLLAACLSALLFPLFERWTDRHILGMPVPPTQLLATYAARISTSLDAQHLTQLLRDAILPSLMVRQSALLRFDEGGRAYFLYTEEVDPSFIPDETSIEILWQQAGIYQRDTVGSNGHSPCSWVRLALPLRVGNQRIGLWLLGRRDPDDYYAQVEIPTLQALADQTAVALLNLAQAERLIHLYQVDIDRQEAERLQLALELHDGVLNQLAILALAANDHSEPFEAAYKLATAHIREVISGLRPTMLNYGLRTALDELADEAPARLGDDLVIEVDLPPSEVRYPPQTELHLYRIVQEACKNALQHSHAKTISISGTLEPDCFDLTVIDDGVGFASQGHLELDALLERKHFGLAGMIERANLIGAQMEINSLPGLGTRVRVYKENHLKAN
ncbi:MAG: hypothetical protein M1281_18445 [Chloroflexi bacterium]|nr:hypothetical protein [Chloroflexota bacterium]